MIASHERAPADFAAYWDALDAELAALPPPPILEPLPLRSSDEYTCYTVKLTSVGPYRIFGYYSVPTGPGPLPGLLLTPRYGSVNHVPDYADRQRYAVLQIMHRGQRLADQPFAASLPRPADATASTAEHAYGPDGRTVAAILHNLAVAWMKMGQPAKARPLLERALVIIEREFGRNHLRVATGLQTLGQARADLGQPDEARDLLVWAVRIVRAHYPTGHSEVLSCERALRRVAPDVVLLDDGRLVSSERESSD